MIKTANRKKLKKRFANHSRRGQKLRNIGICSVADLKGKNPQKLYEASNRFAGKAQDRCLLYVFREAVYFAENSNPDPERLKWWYWKDN